MPREKITVLMSVYNGHLFLKKQIESIMNQRNVDVSLVARDDGSSDDSLLILKEMKRTYPQIEIVEGVNLGFIRSFGELVFYASNRYSSQYYAFADQDDIWNLDKLQTGVRFLRDNATVPAMWCCNSMVINSKDEPVRVLRTEKFKFTKGNCLYGCKIQGCTMVFNDKALNLFALHRPERTCHDTWLVYICNFFGVFHYDDTPFINYRVHANNAIGASMGFSWKEKWKKRINNWLNNKYDNFLNATDEFYKTFEEQLNEDDRKVIKIFSSYKTNFKSKLALIFLSQYGAPVEGKKNALLFGLHVLFNHL